VYGELVMTDIRLLHPDRCIDNSANTHTFSPNTRPKMTFWGVLGEILIKRKNEMADLEK